MSELERHGMQQLGTVMTPSNGGDMSQAQIILGPIDVRFCDVVSIQAIAAGNPAGTLQLQGCVGQPTKVGGVNTWPQTFSNIGSPFTVAGAGSWWFDYSTGAPSALQIVFTKGGTSSGALSGSYNTKGRG